MKEEMFYLDGKGILPRDFYNEIAYIHTGYFVLKASLSDEFLKETKKILPYGNIRYEKLNKKILEKFKKRFHCDMSWVRAFTGSSLDYGAGRANPIVYHGRSIPVMIRGPSLFSKKVYTHELIHVIRFNLDDGENALEETYADKFYWVKEHKEVPLHETLKCWFKIRKAEKKLEDVVGDYKEYVSIRLNEKEIRHIADTSNVNIKEYLKSQKKLRHKIIIEKLSL